MSALSLETIAQVGTLLVAVLRRHYLALLSLESGAQSDRDIVKVP